MLTHSVALLLCAGNSAVCGGGSSHRLFNMLQDCAAGAPFLLCLAHCFKYNAPCSVESHRLLKLLRYCAA